MRPGRPPAGDRAEGQRRAPAVPRVYLIVGSLLSVAAGLLLALLAFGVTLVFEGHPTEGGYCSEYGIGRYEAQTPARMVVYLDEGWSGPPPRQHCKVYLVDATGANPPSEEELRRDPRSSRLLAEGTYPGTHEYTWIAGAFLLPLAIWSLLLAIARFAGRGRIAED